MASEEVHFQISKLSLELKDLQTEFESEVRLRLKTQLEAEQLRSALEESFMQRKLDQCNFETELRFAKFEAEQNRQDSIFWKAKHEDLMNYLKQIEVASLQPKPDEEEAESSESEEEEQKLEEEFESDLDYSELYLEEKSKVHKLVKTVEDLLLRIEDLDQLWKQRRVEEIGEADYEKSAKCIICEKLTMQNNTLMEANARLTEDLKKLHSAIAKLQLLRDRDESPKFMSLEEFFNKILDLAKREEKLASYREFASSQTAKVEAMKNIIEQSRLDVDKLYKDNALLRDRLKVLESNLTEATSTKIDDSILKTIVSHLEQQVIREVDKVSLANSKLSELQAELKNERNESFKKSSQARQLEVQVKELKLNLQQAEGKVKEYQAVISSNQISKKTDEFLAQLNKKHSQYAETVKAQKTQLEMLQVELANKLIELGEVRMKARHNETFLLSKLENASLQYHNETESALVEIQERLKTSKAAEYNLTQKNEELVKELVALRAEAEQLSKQLEAATRQLNESTLRVEQTKAALASLQTEQTKLLNEKAQLALDKTMMNGQIYTLTKSIEEKDAKIQTLQTQDSSIARLAEIVA